MTNKKFHPETQTPASFHGKSRYIVPETAIYQIFFLDKTRSRTRSAKRVTEGQSEHDFFPPNVACKPPFGHRIITPLT